MNSPAPRVSFLVVNWNGGAMLRECLDAVAAQTCSDYEVIVVDNGSTDRSADLPHFDRAGWTLIRLDANEGYSPANNRAFAASRGEWLALVNNDVVLDPDWLARMLEAGDRTPAAGAVACRLLQWSSPDRLDCAGFEFFSCATTGGWVGQPAAAFDHDNHAPLGAVAAAALYRRQAIEDVGLFHPGYFAYYEDTDLGLRLVLHGYDCAYAPAARARHRGSATGARGSAFAVYHLRRNVELLYWVDFVGALAWRHLLPHLLYEALCFAAAIPRGRAGAVLRAKRDAWRLRGWIRQERRLLRERLAAKGGAPAAQARLRSRMVPWWRVFARAENRLKFRGSGGSHPQTH